MSEKKCYACKGSGKIPTPEVVRRHRKGNVGETITCHICQGSGTALPAIMKSPGFVGNRPFPRPHMRYIDGDVEEMSWAFSKAELENEISSEINELVCRVHHCFSEAVSKNAAYIDFVKNTGGELSARIYSEKDKHLGGVAFPYPMQDVINRLNIITENGPNPACFQTVSFVKNLGGDDYFNIGVIYK